MKMRPTQAVATRLEGKKPWRVTDEQGRPLKTREGKPLDRGGYARGAQAKEHADAINRATYENQRAGAKTKVTKRQRVASRRAVKQAQRERLKQLRDAEAKRQVSVRPEIVEAVESGNATHISTRSVAEVVHDLGQGNYPTSRVDINDSPGEALAKMRNAKAGGNTTVTVVDEAPAA